MTLTHRFARGMCGGAVALFLLAAFAQGQEAPFLPVVSVTGDMPDARYRMTWNSGRQMATDSQGRLHLTFFSGHNAIAPGQPSYVHYRRWFGGDRFSRARAVDNSLDSQGLRVGGRQPNLLIAPDDTIWITWHDHRHGSAAGNWIDNVEIYTDRAPTTGSFSSEDIRITRSSAIHQGDNGYSPRLARRTDGALGVVWFDYHADAGIADLYYTQSDARGSFTTSTTMAQMRLTDAAGRGRFPSYGLPDIAVDSSDTVHCVWTGAHGSPGALYYASFTTTGGLVAEQTLDTGSPNYWDPPRLFTTPAKGEVWLVWTDLSSFPTAGLKLRRRVAGFDWEPEISLGLSGYQSHADAAFGPDGQIHLTWVNTDGAGGATSIGYGRYDPVDKAFERQETLSQEVDVYPRPSIHVSASGHAYVMWGKDNDQDDGDLFLATTDPNAYIPPPWSGLLAY